MEKQKEKSLLKKAAEQWLEENPSNSLANCKSSVVVQLSDSGKVVQLGKYLIRIRLIYNAMQKGKHYGTYKDLTEEEIKWWTDRGMDWKNQEIANKNIFREAAEQWLKENPGNSLANCKSSVVVQLSDSGKKVKLGQYLIRIRMIYNAMQKGKRCGTCKDLTEEEIKWWTDRGMDWNRQPGIIKKK